VSGLCATAAVWSTAPPYYSDMSDFTDITGELFWTGALDHF